MLLASSFTDACLAAEALTLAKDGNAKAVIVLPSGATSAARETGGILADHLKQICGGEFRIVGEGELKDASVKDQRIVTKSTESVENFILLGEGRLTKLLGATSADLGPGGILIRTFPNALVLLGPGKTTPSDPYGTRYAVTTFLEDSLGCRFLWPGELGKVVPQRKTIEIAPINFSYTPMIRQRRIRMAMGLGERKAQGVKRLGFTDADYHRFNSAAMKTDSRDGGWPSRLPDMLSVDFIEAPNCISSRFRIVRQPQFR